MIVYKVALLLSEVELRDKAGNSKFLDDLEDVELGVEAASGLALEFVQFVLAIGLPAAEAPGAGEVLLAEEAPHTVVEGLTAPFDLSQQVVDEWVLVLWSIVVFIDSIVLILSFLDIVVQLLGHGVVKRESLVGTENVADETKAEGEV